LLLADDSVTIQRVIELTFADEDVKVVAVSDGEQAIASVDQRPPDIVLADVGMPGRDGYEVAHHIKNNPRLAHIPVVLLTGAFEPIDQARAAAVGCDGVLAKPFEPQLVIGRVKELLARGESGTMLRMPEPPAVDHPPLAAEPPQAADEERILAPAHSSERRVDTYFDELDQAFATLSAGHKTPPRDRVDAAKREAIQWFSQPAPAEPAPEFHQPTPLIEPPPPIAVPAPRPEPNVTAPPPAVAASPAPLPSLADAFTALLAAEQTSEPAAAAPVWPAAASPTAASPALIDEVTRQVLARIADQRTVRDIVTEVAERLVREEIERIKRSIDSTSN
jgi:CheY-like chemotaxis protein